MAEITWKYVKEIKNANAIEEFEKTNSIQFPDDLRSILKKYNNGRPSAKCFDTQNAKEKEFKKLLSFNKDDTENIFEFVAFDTKLSGLIPFADDPSGNLICLYQGKIYYWLHESDSVEYLADSFTEFLGKLY